MGQRLTVQFARGPRDRDTRGGPPPGAAPGGGGFYGERSAPRTRRTVYRMTMAGLPPETSWQVCALTHSKRMFLLNAAPGSQGLCAHGWT